MTTAHRATWRSARGGDQEDGSFRLHVGTAQVSAKAAPSHRELKTRADNANGKDDRAKMREMLEKTEEKNNGDGGDEELADYVRNPDIRALDDDALLDDDIDIDDEERPRAPKRARTENNENGNINATEDDYSDDSDDDEEDDEELLRRELQKIRAERAAQRAADEAEKAEAGDGGESVLGVNPLLDFDDTASIATATTNASVAVKRRWNDDVIFKNQARGERKAEQRFVNDTVRNDFHRRFLRRYIL